MLNLRFQDLPQLSRGQKLSDREAMILALRLAYEGAGFVSPNPQVGCVVLDKNNCYLSSGYHQKWGEGHAEVNAIKGLSDADFHGARIFVTLEPCAHEGKTPSCAKMLAKLPISEVVYGIEDPNPLVAGKGAEILRQAGKKTELFHPADPDLSHELRKVCEVFLKNFINKKPFVALKWAQSLDAQMGLSNGESRWITNDDSRKEAHQLRAIYDLTLVGVETFLRDQPHLDIRHPRFVGKKNYVGVLDPQGRALNQESLEESPLFQSHDRDQIFWFVGKTVNLAKDKIPAGLNVIRLEAQNNRFDPAKLMSSLWDLKMKSVLIEGGPSTLSHFLNAQMWDRLHVFQAPLIIGDQGQKSWAGEVPWTSMDQTQRLHLDEWHLFQSDIYQSFSAQSWSNS